MEAFPVCSRRQHFCFRIYGDRADVPRRPRDGNAPEYGDAGQRIFRIWPKEKSEDFLGQPTPAEVAIWRCRSSCDNRVLLRCSLAVPSSITKAIRIRQFLVTGETTYEYESPADRAGHRAGDRIPAQQLRL